MIREVNDMKPEEREAHEQKWGRFNDAPPGWEEIDETAVTDTPFRTHHPEMTEYRQIFPRRDPPSISMGPALAVTLYYFYDGTGVGMHIDALKRKIRWFRFGCRHDMEVWWPRMFERHDKCKKCGREFVYDTSG